MAATTAAAITFPGGRGWAAEPKMSALISVWLGLVSQCRSCLPSAESTHSTRGRRRIVRTHTPHTPHSSSCCHLPHALLAHAHTPQILPFLLLRTLALCLCHFHLSRSIIQVFRCPFFFFFADSLPHPRKEKKTENKAPPPSKQDVFFSFLCLVIWRARFKH